MPEVDLWLLEMVRLRVFRFVGGWMVLKFKKYTHLELCPIVTSVVPNIMSRGRWGALLSNSESQCTLYSWVGAPKGYTPTRGVVID